MARVVLTYTAPGGAIADRLETWMRARGHDVAALRGLRLSGEGPKDRAVAEINRAEYVLALLTRKPGAGARGEREPRCHRTVTGSVQKGTRCAI